MKTNKMLKKGLGLAIAVFVSNAVLVPIISGGNVANGVMTGLIAATFVLVFYSLVALPQWEKKSDAAEES